MATEAKDAPAYERAKTLANRHGVSVALIYKLVRFNKLPARRVGRLVLIGAAEAKKFFEGGDDE